VAKTVAAYGSDAKKSTAVEQLGVSVLCMPNIGRISLRWSIISSQAL